jgi:hypothetical protein
MGTPLNDGDYLLADNAAWIEVKGFAIRIRAGDDGLSVVVYRSGAEDEPAITETWAAYGELEPDPYEHACDNPDCMCRSSEFWPDNIRDGCPLETKED